MSNTPYVILRNTISGIAHEYTQEEAERIRNHPIFGRVNVEVRTAKPEVLHYGDAVKNDEPETISDEDDSLEEFDDYFVEKENEE